MGRKLVLICLALIAIALVSVRAQAENRMLTVSFRVEVETVSVGESPWGAYGYPATKATFILDWNDYDGTPNGTQYKVRRSIDGGDWENLGTVIDTQGTQYADAIDPVYLPGNAAWVQAAAEAQAKRMATAGGKSTTYEVFTYPCNNHRGEIELNAECESNAAGGIASTSSGSSSAASDASGNSPTGFYVNYTTKLIDTYVGWTSEQNPGIMRETDICPGWVHNWDKRLVRFDIDDGGYKYELWRGTSRIGFSEDENGGFHCDPDVKNFSVVLWTYSDPDELQVRYGGRVLLRL